MKIGIVGLGMGGATAAAAMVLRGMDVTVFEQASEVREVGAGIATWPNTVRLLNRMGLAEKLAAIGCPHRSYPIRDPSGTMLQCLSTDTYDGTAGYNFHRAELLQTIAALIPRDRIRLGSRTQSVSQIGDKAVVMLENGRSEEFDVVIGADGIRSVVCDAVTRSSPPKYSNLAAYRGLVKNEGVGKLEIGNLWTDRRKYMIAFPVSGGALVNFVGVVPTPGLPDESWFMSGSKEALAEEYKDWDPVVRSIIGQVEETFRWGLYYREPLSHIVRGRIALLGDAAHPMLINAGQGAGQALEDAVAIATLLDGATPDTVEQRLRMYEQLRLPRATEVQTLSRRNAQFMHLDFPVEPGMTRPDQAGAMNWIFDYDVEYEAEKLILAK